MKVIDNDLTYFEVNFIDIFNVSNQTTAF